MKIKVLLFVLFYTIFSLWKVFWWWVYNIYNEKYTYAKGIKDNRFWHDPTNDHCKSWEMVLKSLQSKQGVITWSLAEWSYRCWKIDKIKPTITISWIKPEKTWVNTSNYNPISSLNIKISDAWAGIRYINLIIWKKRLEFSYKGNSIKNGLEITYNAICSKTDCYKKLLPEWKNLIRVYACDAALSYNDGKVANRSYSNCSKPIETEIWVDNSSSTLSYSWDKYFWSTINGPIENFSWSDNKWKNKTLKIISIKTADKYSAWLRKEEFICSWNPNYSAWIAPYGVDEKTWKFTAYCDKNNKCSPSISDCKWSCIDGYVKSKDGKRCVIEKIQNSCYTYFQNQWYNLKNVDGEKIYFSLKWYGSSVIDSKTWKFTAVYDSEKWKYLPDTSLCQIVPWNVEYTLHAKDANGNNTILKDTTNGVLSLWNIISVIPSIQEKSCNALWPLIDFQWAWWNNNQQWWWDKQVPVYWISLSGYNLWVDDNNNQFVDEKDEWRWYFIDANTQEYTTDIEKACGKAVCVAHSYGSPSNGCKCTNNYYAIDSEKNDNRYDFCVSVPTDSCMKDANWNGSYDSVVKLKSNQVVHYISTSYSKDKVPACGKVCSKWYIAKDTNGDGRKDSCAKKSVYWEKSKKIKWIKTVTITIPASRKVKVCAYADDAIVLSALIYTNSGMYAKQKNGSRSKTNSSKLDVERVYPERVGKNVYKIWWRDGNSSWKTVCYNRFSSTNSPITKVKVIWWDDWSPSNAYIKIEYYTY